MGNCAFSEQSLEKSRVIDLNARRRFEDEIQRGYAGISFVQSITKTVKCINTHNREFRDGRRGPRDATRAKVHFEAAQLANGPQAVLAAFLHIGSMGKKGTVCTEDVSAAMVRRVTGARCAPRTYRRHLAAVCKAGFLSKARMPTGTRIKKGDGTWTTFKVCKVTLTPAAQLLISKNYISLPRPKWPITEGDNNRERENGTFSLPVESDNIDKMGRRAHVVGGSEESLRDNSTPPPKATVKHRTLKSAPRTAAKRAAPVSARKNRTSVSKTWRTARRTLLAELFAFLHADPLRDELYRIAELQTECYYPAAMLTALDWDDMVLRWLMLKWHDRRRALKNEIAPALRAFADHLKPPGRTIDDRPAEIRAELEAWLAVIPEHLPESVPEMIKNRMEKERWRLNMLVRSIHAGHVDLASLSPDDHMLLHQSGFLKGG